jgi:hypothetical protein
MNKSLNPSPGKSLTGSVVLCPPSPSVFQRRLPLAQGPNLDCDGCMQVIQTVAEFGGKTRHKGF